MRIAAPATHAPTPGAPWLVADIGGTHARFGLVAELGGEALEVRILRCAEFPDLVAAVENYLDRIPSGARPSMACAAVAGPVRGDRFRLTNAHWDFSISESRIRLGLDRLELINDFTALALAVPDLPDSAFVRIGSGVRWAAEPMVVIGPGTGLGVSGLMRVQQRWIAIPGEGGHAGLPVETEQETQVARVLREQHPVVDAETALSGPGLGRLYRALCVVHGVTPAAQQPEQVCTAGRRGTDDLAREALSMFCGMLGTFAGNVALTLGARGGVLLGGGILPGIVDFLADSDFRARFIGNRSIAGYLDPVATELIVAATPALRGAAVALEQHRLIPETV
ncbi:glucokinase [Nocardia jiangxiensis]|uniref:Glucokinase n=1 Tax=Nocardia jiangxiensis TaxID=282685 RepID=A0ABW6S464_9NOCA|nr:glucokinase [Nocardia jiangxiensis]